MTDRYEGKPFLRLLDSYVLDTIGHLDDANQAWLVEAEPFFRATFEAEGGWRDIVRSRMQFPEGMDAAIQEFWNRGRLKFIEQNGTEPEPVQFTHMFVDKNFPH